MFIKLDQNMQSLEPAKSALKTFVIYNYKSQPWQGINTNDVSYLAPTGWTESPVRAGEQSFWLEIADDF
jgi:hypothetical protein